MSLLNQQSYSAKYRYQKQTRNKDESPYRSQYVLGDYLSRQQAPYQMNNEKQFQDYQPVIRKDQSQLISREKSEKKQELIYSSQKGLKLPTLSKQYQSIPIPRDELDIPQLQLQYQQRNISQLGENGRVNKRQPSQRFLKQNLDYIHQHEVSQSLPNINQSIKPYQLLSKPKPVVEAPNQHQINENIHQIISQIGASTLAGQHPNGVQKTNQDSIIMDKLQGLYAVADGHGQNGDKVSNFLRQTLPKNLQKFLATTNVQSYLQLKDTLLKVFRQTNQELWNSNFDCSLAGSTLVSVLLLPQSQKLYTANVGDSRAVLGKHTGSGWQPIELTKDQKPSVPEEAKRIIQLGGRVEHQTGHSYGNFVGPLRVWMKNIQAPGLAMTRSFGDKVGAQAGVIAIPDVMEFTLTKQDKFIIIASDGVWEHLSNFEIISFAGNFYDKGMSAQGISENIVARAIDSWKQNSLSRDDITCICIFINP